jgi:NTP pyrophosphatase (non-canonical NTP hydrolase)
VDSAPNAGGCAVAIEQDWRNSSKYYLSPEQESAVKTRSISWYGADTQATVCMEECAELIQAISKLKRYNPEDPHNKVSRNELIENLYEEMADVQICFDLLVSIYDLKPSDLRRMMDHKVWRMKQKMELEGEKF